MPIKLRIYPLFFAFLLLAACSGGSQTAPPRVIDRLDVALADSTAPLSSAEEAAFAQWCEIVRTPADRGSYASRPDVMAFSAAIDSLLLSLAPAEAWLGQAFAADSAVRLFGVVNPYNQPVVTTPDGTIFVGLNHYLGAGYDGYAGRFPTFLRHLKTVERLPIDIVEARLAQLYPARYSEAAPTLLSRMLYQGALLCAVARRLDAAPAEVLGMSAEDYAICRAHEADIWQAIAGRKLLYSSDPAIAERLLQPAPSSPLISPEAPGRAALFCAMQIVEAYCRKNNASPLQILESQAYNDRSTLIKSSYNPQNATL